MAAAVQGEHGYRRTAIVLLDRMGAGRGSTVLVSSDGTIARDWLGKGVPARLVVVGIVDRVAPPPALEGQAS